MVRTRFRELTGTFSAVLPLFSRVYLFSAISARRSRGENVTAMMSWLIGVVMPLDPVERPPRRDAQ